MSEELPIFDLSNKAHVRMVVEYIKTRKGLHRIAITKCREQRTLSQNSFYWAVVLPVVARGMSEHWGEDVSVDEAHEYCKKEFNSRTIADRNTGEARVAIPQSSGALDTAQFSKYLERIIKFAGEQLGVDVPDAQRFREGVAA